MYSYIVHLWYALQVLGRDQSSLHPLSDGAHRRSHDDAHLVHVRPSLAPPRPRMEGWRVRAQGQPQEDMSSKYWTYTVQ